MSWEWEESRVHSPDDKPLRWVMKATGHRREVALIRANLGHPRTPCGVWASSALGCCWDNPDSLRETANVLNAMADKWDELAEQFPEVAMIRRPQ